jgi:uncharacterized repeat protein (TIGR01451 family)
LSAEVVTASSSIPVSIDRGNLDDQADPIDLGQVITYNLSINNLGPDDALNVSVTDTLPAEVSFVSASPSQGTCEQSSNLVCSLGTINAGSSASLEIQLQAMTSGIISNPIQVTSDTVDPYVENNQATETTTVNPPGTGADLSLSMMASLETVGIGENYNYTLVISNLGPEDAFGVVLNDTLPAKVSFVSVTSTQGSCQLLSDLVCDLGTIAKGGQVTVNLVVEAISPGVGVNTAKITSTSNDSVQTNNAASDEIVILDKNATKIFLPLLRK